jgi:hypothetical protein
VEGMKVKRKRRREWNEGRVKKEGRSERQRRKE